jgi:hypothetical protein
MSTNEERRAKAQQFHWDHPEVWDLFVKFTLEKINAGFSHYSVRGIWHRIRWETPAGDDGVVRFKLGDHHAKFYGRRFMKMYPQHEGFFRKREDSKAKVKMVINEQTPSFRKNFHTKMDINDGLHRYALYDRKENRVKPAKDGSVTADEWCEAKGRRG